MIDFEAIFEILSKYGYSDYIRVIKDQNDINGRNSDYYNWNALHFGLHLIIYICVNLRVYPLIIASLEGNKDVVEVLLGNNADVNFQTDSGSTALHIGILYCTLHEFLLIM